MQVQIAGMMFGFRGPAWTEPDTPADQPALGTRCAAASSRPDGARLTSSDPHRDGQPWAWEEAPRTLDRAELGTPEGQGTPSALTSRTWSSLLPEDTQLIESESERRMN